MYLRPVIKQSIRIVSPIMQFILQLHPMGLLILFITILYAFIKYILPNWWPPFYPTPTKTPLSAPLRTIFKSYNYLKCPICGQTYYG